MLNPCPTTLDTPITPPPAIDSAAIDPTVPTPSPTPTITAPLEPNGDACPEKATEMITDGTTAAPTTTTLNESQSQSGAALNDSTLNENTTQSNLVIDSDYNGNDTSVDDSLSHANASAIQLAESTKGPTTITNETIEATEDTDGTKAVSVTINENSSEASVASSGSQKPLDSTDVKQVANKRQKGRQKAAKRKSSSSNGKRLAKMGKNETKKAMNGNKKMKKDGDESESVGDELDVDEVDDESNEEDDEAEVETEAAEGEIEPDEDDVDEAMDDDDETEVTEATEVDNENEIDDDEENNEINDEDNENESENEANGSKRGRGRRSSKAKKRQGKRGRVAKAPTKGPRGKAGRKKGRAEIDAETEVENAQMNEEQEDDDTAAADEEIKRINGAKTGAKYQRRSNKLVDQACDQSGSPAPISDVPIGADPCEPGTNVLLQGIVWTETESGVLVVNVSWRGKTYVGTLLDATKQEWQQQQQQNELQASAAESSAPAGVSSSDTASSSAANPVSCGTESTRTKRPSLLDANMQLEELNSQLCLDNPHHMPIPGFVDSVATKVKTPQPMSDEKPSDKDDNKEETKTMPDESPTSSSPASSARDSPLSTQATTSSQPATPQPIHMPIASNPGTQKCIVQSTGIVFPPYASDLNLNKEASKEKPRQLQRSQNSSFTSIDTKSAKKQTSSGSNNEGSAVPTGSPGAYSDISEANNEYPSNEPSKSKTAESKHQNQPRPSSRNSHSIKPPNSSMPPPPKLIPPEATAGSSPASNAANPNPSAMSNPFMLNQFMQMLAANGQVPPLGPPGTAPPGMPGSPFPFPFGANMPFGPLPPGVLNPLSNDAAKGMTPPPRPLSQSSQHSLESPHKKLKTGNEASSSTTSSSSSSSSNQMNRNKSSSTLPTPQNSSQRPNSTKPSQSATPSRGDAPKPARPPSSNPVPEARKSSSSSSSGVSQSQKNNRSTPTPTPPPPFSPNPSSKGTSGPFGMVPPGLGGLPPLPGVNEMQNLQYAYQMLAQQQMNPMFQAQMARFGEDAAKAKEKQMNAMAASQMAPNPYHMLMQQQMAQMEQQAKQANNAKQQQQQHQQQQQAAALAAFAAANFNPQMLNGAGMPPVPPNAMNMLGMQPGGGQGTNNFGPGMPGLPLGVNPQAPNPFAMPPFPLLGAPHNNR